MGRSWTIFRVGGIPVRIDSSWAFIAILIVYSLWIRFTIVYPSLGDTAGFALAILGAVLFFGSVLLHELAHAGMARARGLDVTGITLFLFGGATSAHVEDKGPKDEFLVTVVGPGTSALLAVAFYLIDVALRPVSVPVGGAFGYVAWVNAILAGFNVLPGFPLDGGRLLRSGIWKVTGSLERATAIAARVGMGLAFAMVLVGALQIARNDLGSGLWTAFLGWFLFRAAQGSVGQQRLRRVLSEGTAAEVMGPVPRTIPAGMTLSETLGDFLAGREREAFPVIDDGRVVGLLTWRSARKVGRREPQRPVRDAMVPLREVPTVRPEDRLDRVAEVLSGAGAALVVTDGRLLGAITSGDLSRWMSTRSPR